MNVVNNSEECICKEKPKPYAVLTVLVHRRGLQMNCRRLWHSSEYTTAHEAFDVEIIGNLDGI